MSKISTILVLFLSCPYELVCPVPLAINVSCHAVFQTDPRKEVFVVLGNCISDRNLAIPIVLCFGSIGENLDGLRDGPVELISLDHIHSLLQPLCFILTYLLLSPLFKLGIHLLQFQIVFLALQMGFQLLERLELAQIGQNPDFRKNFVFFYVVARLSHPV